MVTTDPQRPSSARRGGNCDPARPDQQFGFANSACADRPRLQSACPPDCRPTPRSAHEVRQLAKDTRQSHVASQNLGPAALASRHRPLAARPAAPTLGTAIRNQGPGYTAGGTDTPHAASRRNNAQHRICGPPHRPRAAESASTIAPSLPHRGGAGTVGLGTRYNTTYNISNEARGAPAPWLIR